MRKLLIGLVALACVASLVPAALAWNHDELPTIAEGGGAGSGWASFKFSTDGSILAFEVNANGLSGSAMAGGDLFDANGNLIFGFTFTAVGFPSSGTLLDLNGPGVGNVHVDTRAPPTNGGGGMGLGLTFNDGNSDTVGTYKLLTWVSGNAHSWDWHMRGPAGDKLLGQLAGSSAFLYGAEDFRGTAYAQSYTGGVGARVAANVAKTIDVKDSLFGVYYDANFKIVCAAVACVGAASTTLLTATDPAGNAQPCGPNTGVISLTFCGYWGTGPGTYSFGLSGFDASETAVTPFECAVVCAGVIPWQDSIILGGADAALPA